MKYFGKKIKTANNNSPRPRIFDIGALERKPFELSRLEGFIDGGEDMFDVLSDTHRNTGEKRIS